MAFGPLQATDKTERGEDLYRESYDMDLLPFQAGSYATDEEETEYLESDLDGIKLE